MSDPQSVPPSPPPPPPPSPPPEHPDPATTNKQTGKVKWFNSSKGFGFVTAVSSTVDSEEIDVFVHQTAIHAQGFRSLQQGEEVEYVAEEGEDGRLRAVQVTGPNGTFVQGATRYGSRGGGGGRGAKAGGGGSTSSATSAAAVPAVNRPAQQQQQQPAPFQFAGACYNCGLVGHMARDCQSPGGYMYAPPPPLLARGRGGRGRRGGPPLRQYPDTRSCYSCGAVGHLQRDCPNFVSA